MRNSPCVRVGISRRWLPLRVPPTSPPLLTRLNRGDSGSSIDNSHQRFRILRAGPPQAAPRSRTAQDMADWARLVLAMRSTSTGTKSRIGLPANRSWEVCTVCSTTSGARSGCDAANRCTTSLTARVSSSGDSIPRMLPPSGDRSQQRDGFGYAEFSLPGTTRRFPKPQRPAATASRPRLRLAGGCARRGTFPGRTAPRR